MYTSGALILTDDGDFVYKITHPKHEITKTYTVTLIGIPTDDSEEALYMTNTSLKKNTWIFIGFLLLAGFMNLLTRTDKPVIDVIMTRRILKLSL